MQIFQVQESDYLENLLEHAYFSSMLEMKL